jgi:hypothetical protein
MKIKELEQQIAKLKREKLNMITRTNSPTENQLLQIALSDMEWRICVLEDRLKLRKRLLKYNIFITTTIIGVIGLIATWIYLQLL